MYKPNPTFRFHPGTGRSTRLRTFKSHMMLTDETHWRTADGRLLRVVDMGANHLTNTMALLRRWVPVAKIEMLSTLVNGRGPQAPVIDKINRINGMPTDYFLVLYCPPWVRMVIQERRLNPKHSVTNSEYWNEISLRGPS